jgi:hypothetical protein
VGDGVEQQVEQDLGERPARRRDGAHLGGEGEPDARALGACGDERRQVVEQRDRLGVRRLARGRPVGVAAREREQAAHETVEPVHLADDERREAGAALGREHLLAAEALGERPDAGERVADLVRDGRADLAEQRQPLELGGIAGQGAGARGARPLGAASRAVELEPEHADEQQELHRGAAQRHDDHRPPDAPVDQHERADRGDHGHHRQAEAPARALQPRAPAGREVGSDERGRGRARQQHCPQAPERGVPRAGEPRERPGVAGAREERPRRARPRRAPGGQRGEQRQERHSREPPAVAARRRRGKPRGRVGAVVRGQGEGEGHERHRERGRDERPDARACRGEAGARAAAATSVASQSVSRARKAT